jgi:flagellar hook-associated protein 2
VKATGSPAAGKHVVSDVASLASASSEISLAGYADTNKTPVSTSGTMRLTVGSKTYDFTVANNSLSGLAQAINDQNAGVSASVFTADGASYLNITATNTGATTLALTDDPHGRNASWLTARNQGSNASFLLNGIRVTRASNTIADAIPGIEITLKSTTAVGQTVQIGISNDPNRILSALKSVAAQYNAAVDEIGKHVGKDADLLTGDSIVREVQEAMRSFVGLRSADGQTTLASLGVAFGTDGKMSVDESVAGSIPAATLTRAFDLLGGVSAIASRLSAYSDPVSGLIKTAVDGLTNADQRLQQRMADITDRVNVMQAALQDKLQRADALLAQLQSQQNMLDATLKGLNLTLYGKQNDS